jgi:hypothetical protein
MQNQMTLFFRIAIVAAIYTFAALASRLADAQTFPQIPNTRPCTAMHGFTGQPVPVLQMPGWSPFWAHAQWMMDGTPTITYGSAYFNLPSYMQVFTSIHECGHLVLRTTDEIEANCYAVFQGRWDPSTFQRIAAYHINFPLPLPPQYGGSGAEFWRLTMARCGPAGR